MIDESSGSKDVSQDSSILLNDLKELMIVWVTSIYLIRKDNVLSY